MTVRLRFQSTGMVPGDGAPVTMRGPSLTIGRGKGNDMVLPDPDRMVSSSHCAIENQNGNIVIIDLSTNGTFLNYGKIPLGKTPTPLNSGDVLTIGPYELVVDIPKKGERIADPLADEGLGYGDAGRAPDPHDLLDAPSPGGDFLDDLLGPSNTNQPVGPKQFKHDPDDPFDNLLAPLGDDQDPFFAAPPAPQDDLGPAAFDHGASSADHFRPASRANVIPDDWDDLLDLGGDKARPAPPRPAPQAAPPRPVPGPAATDDPFAEVPPAAAPAAPEPPTEEAPRTTRSAPVAAAAPEAPAEPSAPTPPEATAAATPAGGSDETARAFLRSLGADAVVEDGDLHATMVRLGGVLKAMISGIREVLMTRTSIKGEFRIDQTMISAAGNNPLKFSITPEQAIEAFARTNAKGYLPAQEATEQALQDIKAHEVAMVTGMEAALKGILKRMDPKALEERLEGKSGGFLSNRKAKYWEAYEEMYAEIADQAENQFHELFAREFSAAYKAQLERLK